METREPLVDQRGHGGRRRRVRATRGASPGEPAQSVVFVPLVRRRTRRRASSRSRTSTASTPSATSDVRLLATIAGSLSVALENARLFDETRQRAAELGDREQRRPGDRRPARPGRADRALGDQIRDDVRRRHRVRRAPRRDRDLIEFPYYMRERARDPTSRRFPFGEGLTSRILESSEPLAPQPREPSRRSARRSSGRPRSRTSVCRSWSRDGRSA